MLEPFRVPLDKAIDAYSYSKATIHENIFNVVTSFETEKKSPSSDSDESKTFYTTEKKTLDFLPIIT